MADEQAPQQMLLSAAQHESALQGAAAVLTKLKEEDLAGDLAAAPHVAAVQRLWELGAPAVLITEPTESGQRRAHTAGSRQLGSQPALTTHGASTLQSQPAQCAHVSALLQVLPKPFDVVAAVDRGGQAGTEDSVRAGRKQPPPPALQVQIRGAAGRH